MPAVAAVVSMATDGQRRDLSGAVAIVTGAGSGVGVAVCGLLAEEGAKILLVGRDEAKLRAVRDRIGGEAEVLAGDVGDSAFCDGAVAAAVEAFGRLDMLVNNAGVVYRGDVAETSDENWAEIMRVNVDGVFYLSRAAVRVMRGRGGAIVNTASTCGLVGAAGLAAYCASKGAVVQLTRAMALDCAPHGITVNAVCPGAIDSPMLYSAYADVADKDSVRRRNEEAIPLKQIATVGEVARAIVYLAGEPHITGSALSIDGGYTAG